MKRHGRNSQDKQCRLGTGSWLPLKIDIWQYLWAILQILKPPPGGRSQLFAAHKHIDPRLDGTRRLKILTPNTQYPILTPNYPTTNQSEECPWADHTCSLNTTLLTITSWLGHMEGISLLWPPLPDKPIKATLFYFTQNAVSMFLFGTGEQRLSFSHTPRWLSTEPGCKLWQPGSRGHVFNP